jgi:hypothetical protein
MPKAVVNLKIVSNSVMVMLLMLTFVEYFININSMSNMMDIL